MAVYKIQDGHLVDVETGEALAGRWVPEPSRLDFESPITKYPLAEMLNELILNTMRDLDEKVAASGRRVVDGTLQFRVERRGEAHILIGEVSVL